MLRKQQEDKKIKDCRLKADRQPDRYTSDDVWTDGQTERKPDVQQTIHRLKHRQSYAVSQTYRLKVDQHSTDLGYTDRQTDIRSMQGGRTHRQRDIQQTPCRRTERHGSESRKATKHIRGSNSMQTNRHMREKHRAVRQTDLRQTLGRQTGAILSLDQKVIFHFKMQIVFTVSHPLSRQFLVSRGAIACLVSSQSTTRVRVSNLRDKRHFCACLCFSFHYRRQTTLMEKKTLTPSSLFKDNLHRLKSS